MTDVISRSQDLVERARLVDSRGFYRFYFWVVLIQGIHVIEHIIQLAQVFVFGVSDDDAFGLLGYFVNFNGTEEWLHLGFNLTYLIALFGLVLGAYELMVDGVIPRWVFRSFLIVGVGLETWHFVEHVVIMSSVIRNPGCPCPGIGDRALNITDTVLHFFYNALTYAAVVAPFVFLRRKHRLNR